MRKQEGYGVIYDPEAPGGKIEYDTVRCPHCCGHFRITPGTRPEDSGGWCFNCCHPVCSKPECLERCVPFERKLDEFERHLRAVLR